MRIRSIHISRQNLQLSRPYEIAFKKIQSVENGIIEITGENGLKGLGTINPSEEVVGETLDDALAILSEENIAWLEGRSIQPVEAICNEIQKRFSTSTTARTGLEIAIYDLYTQSMHLPLVNYLGRKIDSMATSITIGIKNTSDTVTEAKEYLRRNFRILKVKGGNSVEEDIERMIELRKTLGSAAELIIDLNQGYQYEDLLRFCKETAHLDIKLIEQPFPPRLHNVMSALPGNIRSILVADESVLTPTDAATMASDSLYGYFNIKLMKCGGISQALQIAQIAKESNIGLMWGCNDESIVSITAALHLAFSCENTRYIDLDGSLDLATDIVKEGFILQDGMMSISDRHGLGLVLA